MSFKKFQTTLFHLGRPGYWSNTTVTHLSVLFIVRRGRWGTRKEACTNTLIIKDKNIAVKFCTHSRSKKAT